MWSRKTHNSISSNRDFLSFCEDLHFCPSYLHDTTLNKAIHASRFKLIRWIVVNYLFEISRVRKSEDPCGFW
ncbi:hypothetical protein ACJA88_010807 [Fusarium oxysporum]